MSKIDITVSRDMTINTGNYSSIKPSVTLTVKDVDAEDASSVYSNIAEVLDDLIMLETVALSNEMESIQEMNYKEYKKMCESSIDAMGGIDNVLKNIKSAFKEI
jgi:hypothetical protein